MKLSLKLLMSAVLVAVVTCATNDRPVIGILTQDTDSSMSKWGGTYLAASYVKYIESAGGRVVPIPFKAEQAEMDRTLSGLNGVLFPGGGADLSAESPFFKAAQYVLNYVVTVNKGGEYMPLWGTCLGFETLAVIVSDNHTILGNHFDSENLTLALDFVSKPSESRLFASAPASVVYTLSNDKVALNNHISGVTPESFHGDANLEAFFKILSLNQDRNNVSFVSTMEGRDWPVYATQWHPEKNQFEWNNHECIDHSSEAISTMQYLADFFVNEARKNSRAYATQQDLDSRLIYNFAPVYTGAEISFEQCYFW
mmetsp:Transcript_6683/g.15389  ORF Transcript_6683/g.15389 Transcript_6683/m.15389 type:complete len:312 (+) Transcript_6683:3-938(+)